MSVTVEQATAWASQGDRKTAVLITLRKDGRAQSSDISYVVVDGVFTISLTGTRAKTANMRRDPRIVLHITDPGSWSYVSLDGQAEIGPVTTEANDAAADDLVEYYRLIAGEHPDWDEYRAAMVAEQRLVLRFSPDSAVGQING